MNILFCTLSSLSHTAFLLAAAESFYSIGHRSIFLVGEKCKDLFGTLPVKVVCSSLFDIDFDRSNPNRLPFRQQILREDRFPLMISFISRLIVSSQIDLVVTDCHFAVPFACTLRNVKWGTLHDGPLRLFRGEYTYDADLSCELEVLANSAKLLGLRDSIDPGIPGLFISPHFNYVFGDPAFLESQLESPIARLPYSHFFGYSGKLWPKQLLGLCRPQLPTYGSYLLSIGTLQSKFDLLSLLTSKISRDEDRFLIVSPPVWERVPIWAERFPRVFDSVDLEYLIENARCVVHHGGAFTTFEVAQAGVPALVCAGSPHTDQPRNALYVERCNLGRIIDPFGEYDLNEMIEVVTSDEVVLAGVAKASERIKGLKTIDEVCGEISEYVLGTN